MASGESKEFKSGTGVGTGGGEADVADKECTFTPKLISRRPTSKPNSSSSSSGGSGGGSSGGGGGGGGYGYDGRRIEGGSASGTASSSSTSATKTKGSARSKSPSTIGRKSPLRGRKGGAARKEKEKEVKFDLEAELRAIVGQEKLKQQLVAFQHGIALQSRRRELGIGTV